MSVLVRGIKNSVRNPVRAASVVGLLGVATAFALTLLVANQAVKNKVEALKSSGATTLTILPAGMTSGPGIEGGGEPLTDDMLAKLKGLAHVTDTGATLGGGMKRFASPATSGGNGPSVSFSAPESEIDLESPVDAGTLGRRGFSNGAKIEDVPDFKLPVQATGVSGTLDASGKTYTLTDGEWFSTEDGYQAVIGKDLATKNNLSVGSTFTGYDQTFTVVGIYDGGSTIANASVLMPLKTFQTLTEQPGEVSSLVVKVDSIENIETVESAINDALGDDNVDVDSSAQNTQDAIASLKSVERISVAGVVIAIAAAGVIVFMIMVMIVRERKREIAVLKAVGGSNVKIVGQFVTEAVVLTLVSVVIGMAISLAISSKVTSLLVSTNTESSEETSQLAAPGGGTVMKLGPNGGSTTNLVGGNQEDSVEDLVGDVATNIGLSFILQGLGAVILIGALGSAIPAFAISKVRPAEVMRGE